MSAVLKETASERAESLRIALKADPSFIGEAIAEGDRTQLVEAFLSGDLQATHDELANMVDDWAIAEERRVERLHRKVPSFQSPDAAMVYLCELHGVGL